MAINHFHGVGSDVLDEAIAALTEQEWTELEQGYLDIAVHELGDWWRPMLRLHEDIDVGDLFCRLYRKSLARASEV